jgi:hypothetical protein
VQIANLTPERRCHHAISFEDRCVARQHEVTTIAGVATYTTTAGRWSWRSLLAGR